MLYRLATGHAPAPEGWTGWTAARAGGVPAERLAAEILGSEAFHAAHGTPDAAALVPLLLDRALGHAASAAEAAPWLAQAAAGLDAAGLLVAIAEGLPEQAWVTVSADGVLFG